MIKAHVVVGARPNFIKVAPLLRALSSQDWVKPVLVHTGQHFSANMSDAFFIDLGMPQPNFHLAARGDTHARQTAAVMVAYEELLLTDRPDWVIVVGDINSTVAAALAAKKLNIRVAHLEAGLRSFDRALPEEINRIVTDGISDLLWTPSPDADANLLREGVAPETIDRVGNIMIDSFLMLAEPIAKAAVPQRLGVAGMKYVVVTLHRQSNVNDPAQLSRIAAVLMQMSETINIIFPVHPRTRAALESAGLLNKLQLKALSLVEPMGYIDFMSLVSDAALIVTDSGGVQEETTFLGIPCLTLRPNTERPITVSIGTNRLVSPETLLDAAMSALRASPTPRPKIELWDGRTAGRVVSSLRLHSQRT